MHHFDRTDHENVHRELIWIHPEPSDQKKNKNYETTKFSLPLSSPYQ